MSFSYPKTSISVLCALLLLGSLSCKRGPSTGDPIPLETEANMADAHKNVVLDVHKITVKEAIPTSKYLYLKVSEDGREYWVATSLKDVRAGETYYYNEALIKTDFESREMQRVFDTIYLVTQIVPESHGNNMQPVQEIAAPPESAEPDRPFHSRPNYDKATPVSIAALLADPAAYKGRVVEISGTCTKVNEGILNRNWIHVKDGTADASDFVVTSQERVQPGEEVTLRAVVYLDRDFGAGYSYEVLLEDGVVVR